MSYTNDRDSVALNQAAAHDTSLYDEGRHDNQIVAMYDTDAEARAAREKLLAQGVPDSSLHVVSRDSGTSTLGGVNAEDRDEGVWGALKSLFVPDDDRSAYSHAVGRGHAMLVVVPSAGTDRTALVHALEATNPVDFDARLEEWRQAGYSTAEPHADYAAMAPLTSGHTVAGSETEYPTPPATATPIAGSTAAVPSGLGVRETTQAGTDVTARGDDDTIKVFEERLRIGKREVNAGAVRIRSYIVERPVEEQVSLHSETVQVERRPVDRAATAADMAAFQERTIEAQASSEEAVVSKDARVVEEIGLKKTASDRVETIRDTVRKTEVEIEDGKTIDPATGKPRSV